MLDYKIIGVLLVIVTVLGGGTIVVFEPVQDLRSHANYTQLALEMKAAGIKVAVIDSSPDKVEIISPNNNFGYERIIITPTSIKVKAGWRIAAEYDFQSRHMGRSGDWLTHYRKKTLTTMTVNTFDDRVEILLGQPYYAYKSYTAKGIKYTGNGGELQTKLVVYEDKIKISQTHTNPYSTLTVCSGIREKRLNEDKAFFIETDPSFTGKEGDTYWYCSEPGEGLESDPIIAVSDSKGEIREGSSALWKNTGFGLARITPGSARNGGTVVLNFTKDIVFPQGLKVGVWFEDNLGRVRRFAQESGSEEKLLYRKDCSSVISFSSNGTLRNATTCKQVNYENVTVPHLETLPLTVERVNEMNYYVTTFNNGSNLTFYPQILEPGTMKYGVVLKPAGVASWEGAFRLEVDPDLSGIDLDSNLSVYYTFVNATVKGKVSR